MAIRDYICCVKCCKKIVYDGDHVIREALEELWGDNNLPTYTTTFLCSEHGGGIARIGPDADRHLKDDGE